MSIFMILFIIMKKKNNIMNLSLILFLIGILGFVLNRKNIILMLISIEIMLLAITFLILISSFSFTHHASFPKTPRPGRNPANPAFQTLLWAPLLSTPLPATKRSCHLQHLPFITLT